MSDAIRDRVLMEALREIPATGVSDVTLANAAEKAGIGKRALQDAFPKGPESLVEAFSDWADRQMEQSVASQGKLRVRERITAAVRARLEALEPHKEAVRAVTMYLAQPQNTVLAAKSMVRSVDAMWRACGDRSSDFSFYTKRATLGAVYGATFAYWLTDASEGHAATWAFLNDRIDNVMSFEKFKASAKEMMAKLPDPMQILHSLRGRPR